MRNEAIAIYVGQIQCSLPYINHYSVKVLEYGTINAVALSSGSDRRGGHRGGASYLPGAWVMIAILDETKANLPGFPHLILGAFSPFPLVNIENGDDEDDDFAPTSIVPDVLSGFNENTAYNHLLNREPQQTLMQDRSFNRILDSMPGDWSKNTPLGGMFYLSDFFARVAASHGCGINFYQLGDLVEIVTRALAVDTETYQQLHSVRGTNSFALEKLAANILEGFGGGEGLPPFKEKDEEAIPKDLEPIEANQCGFFRHLAMSGGDVEGFWDVIRAKLLPGAVNTYDSRHYGLLSEQKRFDGTYRLQAAREIRFEKTSFIRVPSELKDIRTADRTDTELGDEVPTWESLGLESEEELRAVLDIVFDRAADHEEVNLFFEGFRKDVKSGIWVLPSLEDIRTALFDNADDPTIPKLAAGQTEYTLEDVITKEVEPCPGKKVKLFKNSSIFLMADDGGLILGDGYGAELRMHRGTVTIASAGDIKVAPGRDLIELVPGKSIRKVKGRAELTSSDGSIAIKAEENLHMLSGNGGEGSTVIENKSTSAASLAEVKEAQLRAGKAISGGVIIRADSDLVALLGRAIYAGGVSGNKDSKAGTSASCDMLFNAGPQGHLMMNAGEFTLAAYDRITMSMVDAISGMVIDRNSLLHICPGSQYLVSSAVYFDKTSSDVQLPKLEEDNIGKNNRVRGNFGPPNVVMQGSLQVKEAISTSSNVHVGGGVSSNQGINGELAAAVSRQVRVTSSQGKSIASLLRNAFTASMTLLESMVDTYGIATDYGQNIIGVAFPDTNSAAYQAQNFKQRSHRWQVMLTESGKWQENSVEHDILEETYPYPGKAAYEDEEAYEITRQDGTRELTFLENYIINA